MLSHTFHKKERLKSRKTIGRIFREGQSFIAYPIRIAWVLQTEEDETPDFPVQFTQSVPKRRYPKAVDRNRIRRRIREAYRLHKHLLYEALADTPPANYALMAIYVGKEELPYETIAKATRKWIKSFVKKVKSQENTEL